MAELIFKGVHKRYGDNPYTIRDVNLHIKDGEFCVFVGPSGCGKSTLLRMVAGLEDITSGELQIGGKRVNETAPSERGVSMVFQSYALYPHMTVYENMGFGLKVAKTDNSTVDQKVRYAAKILQLDHLLERLPKELSGGQRQRVAIGRAIVREPGVFLFDEPLSNLDAALRVKTRIEIARLHKDMGHASMIYVTHDQVEAMTLADKILLLNSGEAVQRDGSVAQCGAPLELYHFPVNKFVAGFIGSPKMNFINAVLERAEPDMAVVNIAGQLCKARINAVGMPVGTPLEIGIRPEHTEVVQGEGENVVHGKVEFIEKLGESSYLYIRMPDAEETVTVRESGDTKHVVGDAIAVYIAPENLHAFKQDGRACARTIRVDSVTEDVFVAGVAGGVMASNYQP
ncbi:ABC transporter ATP-binding protein [Hydromonas duriensis]|uniref:Carbohydrate ABC transporter ATP-binding protein (CUT1 family) n=1 Tax=Hydromonas duriensis TaxID=1527608 RepID=A0A4R6YC37_9BURK|nr:sn-glycerol-3-phosphate ABC transporter ATP-binding protein UgpC [Hydromonas duriensis]TDR33184.1 carbohydrate ABC transporter ATP-binding protein (CUT1 family) [Hydromonas duriensis]